MQGALPAPTAKFLKEHWSRRRPDSLDRRLTDLVHQLTPHGEPFMTKLRQQTALADLYPADSVYGLIRKVRNDLAHGSRHHDTDRLAPLNDALDRLCRAHMLRLLECPAGVIGQPLAKP